MELEKEGDHAATFKRLADLRADEPPYVPAFFMAAQQLVGLKRIEEARTASATASNKPVHKAMGMRLAKSANC